MKDPWIKPFQERLGDYELDIPVPTATPRRVTWPLLLSAAAAAAVLAMFLLLPSRKSEPAVHAILRTPAECPASLLAENIPHPRQQPLPRHRTVLSEVPTQPETAAEEGQPSPLPEAVSETIPEVIPEAVQDAPRETVPETVQETVLETVLERELETDEPVSASARGKRLSAQIHAGYIQNGSTVSGASTESANPAQDLIVNKMTRDLAFPVPENTEQWTCLLPVKTGLALRYQITPVFGLESGVDYSYHQARETGGQGRICRLHYIGIPLRASVRMAEWERMQAYAAFGGEIEWLAGGRILLSSTQDHTSLRTEGHPGQYSLTGSAGIHYGLTERIGLYVEPGLAWYFHTGGDLPNYYREHPLSFDLRAGLRFNL